jgi:hypothetical protein
MYSYHYWNFQFQEEHVKTRIRPEKIAQESNVKDIHNLCYAKFEHEKRINGRTSIIYYLSFSFVRKQE